MAREEILNLQEVFSLNMTQLKTEPYREREENVPKAVFVVVFFKFVMFSAHKEHQDPGFDSVWSESQILPSSSLPDLLLDVISVFTRSWNPACLLLPDRQTAEVAYQYEGAAPLTPPKGEVHPRGPL